MTTLFLEINNFKYKKKNNRAIEGILLTVQKKLIMKLRLTLQNTKVITEQIPINLQKKFSKKKNVEGIIKEIAKVISKSNH